MGLEGTFTQYTEANHRAHQRAVATFKSALEEVRQIAPYFNILKVDVTNISKQQLVDTRKRFKKLIRPEFIRWVSWSHEAQLKEFGLDDAQIEYMSTYGQFPKAGQSKHPHKFAGCNIDHIIPISAGGKNDFSNLCFIPIWINTVKGNFEHAQRAVNPNTSRLHILVPPLNVDGKYPVFPHFPDEFYISESKNGRQRKPTFAEHTQPTP